jgi:basic amino acid/polyamine antiporter, APA family
MEHPDLRRVLGPFDAGCIVVGAVIGVGIFFTPSSVALLAGSADFALLAWALGGAIALLGALSFAELGGIYHRSGGQYEILRDAYGPFPAFLFVFCNATAIQSGAIAIIAVICMRNLAVAVVDSPLHPNTQLLGAVILIALLAIANFVGVRWGATIQNVTVVAKLIALVVVIILAVVKSPAPGSTTVLAESASMPGLFAALVPALFTFGGWQQALWIGGEIREPARNIPRAILGGMVLVVAIYLLINWAYLHLLGYAAVAGSKTLAADAAAVVWTNGGRRAIALAVALSAFGVLNVQLLSGPRLVYGMACDGRFFAPFRWVHPQYKTPAAAIVLLAVAALVLLLAAGQGAVDKILNGAVFIDTVFFIFTGLALFVLRSKRPDILRPFRVPGYPVVPALFVIGEIGVLIGAFCDDALRPAAIIGAAWIAAAALCYAAFFRRSGVPTVSLPSDELSNIR